MAGPTIVGVSDRVAHSRAGQVIRLTELAGSPVRGPDGEPAGRIADVLAGVEGPYPAVTGILVGAGRA